MAELEIDKEDVHDRKKWTRNVIKRLQAVERSETAVQIVSNPPAPRNGAG